jgi:prepilin peptidase CpaA
VISVPAGLAAVLVFLAALTDWREFRIPNRLVAGIAALSLLGAFLDGSAVGWKEAGIVFAAAACLYAAGMMGGGDVKMLSACALWCPGNLPALLLGTAVSGGILALGLLAVGFVRKKNVPRVPYGVAIGTGTFLAVGAMHAGK